MSKQETRVAVQIVGVVGPDDDLSGLFVLASDKTLWKYSKFKDLFFWQPIDPLPSEEDPGPLPWVARHKALCDALKQLQLGADLAEATTAEVVACCRGVVPDATSDEILAALRSVGRKV